MGAGGHCHQPLATGSGLSKPCATPDEWKRQGLPGFTGVVGWEVVDERHVSTLVPPMTALRFECQRDVHDNCILGHPPRSFPFNIFFYTFSPISNRLHCQISQHPTDTAATDI